MDMLAINLSAFVLCLIVGLVKLSKDEDLFGAVLLFLSGMNLTAFLGGLS